MALYICNYDSHQMVMEISYIKEVQLHNGYGGRGQIKVIN
jgi:hypothetical protein